MEKKMIKSKNLMLPAVFLLAYGTLGAARADPIGTGSTMTPTPAESVPGFHRPMPDFEMPDLSKMLKHMGSMTSDMINAQYDTLAKPETAEKLATFCKNYYDALIRKGFTKDEALRIVSNGPGHLMSK